MSRPVTFLTGASSGIGRALAPVLAGEGHAVALAARRREVVGEVAEEIRREGGTAMALELDVRDREAVLEAVARCEDELGPVERLVANAGISENTPADAFDGVLFTRIIEANVLGAAYCIEAVLPGMIERRRGHIVGMASLAAIQGLPRSAAYTASKAALDRLLESIRLDLRPHGVDVTTIFPGYIRTPMTDRTLHPMPFLMDLDDAVRKIHRAIRRRRRTCIFPWPLAMQARLARLLPRAAYDWLASLVVERGKELDPRSLE